MGCNITGNRMTNVLESKNPLPPTPLAALREWARTVLYPDGSLAAFAVRAQDHRQTVSGWFSADGSVWDGPAPLVVLPKGMGLWEGRNLG